MRSSFYVFTLTGKKLITLKFLAQNKTDKERTVTKPLQFDKKRKTQMHTQTEQLRKKFQS